LKKLHAEGKMTARERIDYLLDPKAKIEIGAFVGEGCTRNTVVAHREALS
jgi:acetyl-CoA carboxylase carboxyltransferase component